ncbi:hypothetical protein D3C84_768170 [compost metagenome]
MLELHIKHPFPHPQRAQLAMIDLQHGRTDLRLTAQLPKIAIEIAFGLLIQRKVINLRLLQRAQAIVDATVHVKYLAMALDERDGG